MSGEIVSSDSVKRIDIKEFVEFGFLQEANRQFFHPLGLALEVEVQEDGSMRLGGVWDYRHDPEGMEFAEGVIEPAKTERVVELQSRMSASREELLGFTIQPVPYMTEAEQNEVDAVTMGDDDPVEESGT